MNTTLATLGLVAVTGALSICDLCGGAAPSDAVRVGFVSAAKAATPRVASRVRSPDVEPARSPRGAEAQAPTRKATEPRTVTRTVTLAVHGMTCGGCVLGTRTTLMRLPGVTKADVSYEKGTAVVTYDPTKVTIAQMIAAIRTLRYTARVVTPPAG